MYYSRKISECFYCFHLSIILLLLHYATMEIKVKLRQIAFDHSSDIEFDDTMKLYRNNDNTLVLLNPLHAWKNLIAGIL